VGSPRLKVGLDTSFLVPLFSVEHEFHEPTSMEWDRLRRANALFVVPCHALLECFAVLTRMPAPYRIAQEEMERLLIESFAKDAEIPLVLPQTVWSSIRSLVSTRLVGGKVYDAVIAQSALDAGAAVLLTWNTKDLLPVAPSGLEVATPSDYAARSSRAH